MNKSIQTDYKNGPKEYEETDHQLFMNISERLEKEAKNVQTDVI